EPFVEERVVGRQEIDDAAAAEQHAFDEEGKLLLHQLAGVEQPARMRELTAVGRDLVELRDPEPLEREAVDERLRARIGEHPLDLRREHAAIAELRLRREVEKLLVRQAAPQEERETRRELEVVERYDAVRPSRLGPIQEVRARENRGERLADAALEPALAKTFV